MVTIDELSPEVLTKIVDYYKKKLNVSTLAEVKAILTTQCFENAVNVVLDQADTRIIRHKADLAKLSPSDEEKIGKIQEMINAVGISEYN